MHCDLDGWFLGPGRGMVLCQRLRRGTLVLNKMIKW